jgi:hypothetical protein
MLPPPMLSAARRYAAAAKKERADPYSANVPVIREIQESGVEALPPAERMQSRAVGPARSMTAQQSSGAAMRESRSPA